MSNEEIAAFFKSLGYTVEEIYDLHKNAYMVIRAYTITTGPLAGKACDIAIQKSTNTPYVAPAAIHTRPQLVPMGRSNTLKSALGSDWQYWSRKLRDQSHPRKWAAHIATIFNEVRL